MQHDTSGRGRGCRVSNQGLGSAPPPLRPRPLFSPASSPRKWVCLLALVFGTMVGLRAQAGALLAEVTTATSERQDEIIRKLKTLDRSAFDVEAERALGQLLAVEALRNQEDYILLAGFLQRADLLELVPEEDRSVRAVRRSINLAKVRAGNEERRDNLLKNLRRLDVNDEFVYEVVPLLVYTRDREIFRFLWELVITESKTCTPPDAEMSGRIDCAYRIVEYLGTAVAGFPVKIDEDHNLITPDYAAALAEIRRWYAAHVKDYEILTNTY